MTEAANRVLKKLAETRPRHAALSALSALSALITAGGSQAETVTRQPAAQQATELAKRLATLQQAADQ